MPDQRNRTRHYRKDNGFLPRQPADHQRLVRQLDPAEAGGGEGAGRGVGRGADQDGPGGGALAAPGDLRRSGATLPVLGPDRAVGPPGRGRVPTDARPRPVADTNMNASGGARCGGRSPGPSMRSPYRAPAGMAVRDGSRPAGPAAHEPGTGSSGCWGPTATRVGTETARQMVSWRKQQSMIYVTCTDVTSREASPDRLLVCRSGELSTDVPSILLSLLT
jgi:hypothetical protein